MKKIVLVLSLLFSSSAVAASVIYSYDSAGRLTRVDYGNGKGVVYTWDAMGNLVARDPLPAGGRHRAVRTADAAPRKKQSTNAVTPTPAAAAAEKATH